MDEFSKQVYGHRVIQIKHWLFKWSSGRLAQASDAAAKSFSLRQQRLIRVLQKLQQVRHVLVIQSLFEPFRHQRFAFGL